MAPRTNRSPLVLDEARRAAPEGSRQFKGESLWTDARRRLRRNRTASFAMWFLVLFGGTSAPRRCCPSPPPRPCPGATTPRRPSGPRRSPPLAQTPAKGTAATEAARNFWNNGWRHRSTLVVSAADGRPRARRPGPRLTGRAPVVESTAEAAGSRDTSRSRCCATTSPANYEALGQDLTAWDVAASEGREAFSVISLSLMDAEEELRSRAGLRARRTSAASVRVLLSRPRPSRAAPPGWWRRSCATARAPRRRDPRRRPHRVRGPAHRRRALGRTVGAREPEGIEHADLGRRAAASLAAAPLDGACHRAPATRICHWPHGPHGRLRRPAHRGRIGSSARGRPATGWHRLRAVDLSAGSCGAAAPRSWWR